MVSCPVIDDIEHAHITGTDVTFDNSIVIACDTGYEMESEASNVTATCLSSGEWSVNISAVECSRKCDSACHFGTLQCIYSLK